MYEKHVRKAITSCRKRVQKNLLLFLGKHPCRRDFAVNFRSAPPEVFFGKSVLKICSKCTGEHPCRSDAAHFQNTSFIRAPLWGCFGKLTAKELHINPSANAMWINPVQPSVPFHRETSLLIFCKLKVYSSSDG